MGKLICTVELSKDNGVTIQVKDADGKVTQTVHMDGETLLLKVAGEENTSTITQKADSIAIACKDFTVSAETITCTSEKASKHTSSDTMTLESTKDMTLSSKAKLVQEATADVEVSGNNVKTAAKSKASIEGMNIEAKAKMGLELEGSLEAKLSGVQVTIKADGKLDAKSSGLATFEGSLNNVKGSLINAG